MSRPESKDVRRVFVATAFLLVSPLYAWCAARHICMDGHMAHPPYPWWHCLIDGTWALGYSMSCVFCWKANLQLRRTFFGLVALLLLSRLLADNVNGAFVFIELPVLLVATTLAIRHLFGGEPKQPTMSVDQRQQRRKNVARRWLIACAIIVAFGCFAGLIGPRCYRLFKTMTAEKVSLADITAPQQIKLMPGKTCLLLLPGGRTVALLSRKTKDSGTGAEIDFTDNAMALCYGEAPYKTDLTYAITQTRQDHSISDGNKTEYILFVDQYALSIVCRAGDKTPEALPVTVSVRHASAK